MPQNYVTPIPERLVGFYEKSEASRRLLAPVALGKGSPQFQDLKRIAVRKDCAFPLHRHSNHELFIPQRGVYECELNSVRHLVRPGEAILVQRGDFHADRYLAGSVFLAVLFSEPADGRESGPIAPKAPAGCRVFRLAAGTRAALLAEALAAGGGPRQDALPVLEPLSTAFFWELIGSLAEKHLSTEFKSRRGGEAFKALAIRLLTQIPANEFDALRLAAGLGLSKRAMEYKFRKHFGRSPAQALLAQKTEEAARLLEDGFSAKEVAAALGFADQFHFSKVFKRFTGKTPSAQRNLR